MPHIDPAARELKKMVVTHGDGLTPAIARLGGHARDTHMPLPS